MSLVCTTWYPLNMGDHLKMVYQRLRINRLEWFVLKVDTFVVNK